MPHKIPLEELKGNPSALHNTRHKIERRKQMLAGERPSECDFCWKIEDTGPNQISDRYLKSLDSWSKPHLDRYSQKHLADNPNPSSVEVSFSSKCNFKCAYCAPDISSKWMEETLEFGAYPTHPSFNNLHYFQVTDRLPIPENQANPYVEAFWQWWPELAKELKVFRITGGEPLLSPNTFRVLEELLKTPRPELSLAVNSNLGVPKVLVQKFSTLLQKLEPGINTKDFTLFTSLDSWGKQAEYIRTGLKMDLFLENLHHLLETLPELPIVIMCTFNALSVVGLDRMIDEVAELKARYNNRVSLDIPFLRYPTFFSANILPPEFHSMLENSLRRMRSMPIFWDHEKLKMQRTLEWMKTPLDVQTLTNEREDFYIYFSEFDRRRGTSFLNTFPEMESFWKLCESAHQNTERPPWT